VPVDGGRSVLVRDPEALWPADAAGVEAFFAD
jgi:hypothetical protein